MPWWVLAFAIFGINLALWGVIGLLRLLETSVARRNSANARAKRILAQQYRNQHGVKRRLTVSDVAVLIAAHNEESVIVDSLRAITALIPPDRVHVVSDGSTDRTLELARHAGVRTISTKHNRGKAGALREGIREFGLVDRFEVVMFLDADTRVEPGYFRAALPLFGDPAVVAVAGCVRSCWYGRKLSPIGRMVAFHRQRIYTMTQYLLKFGQTWNRLNATHIVPGFASLYRTAVLPLIEMNPPGLVIEDFNMTFEVYQKRLGKVGFSPSAVAVTQDPGNLHDYVKQCSRWSLGLWQTVRRHPPKANLFSGMLTLLLLELLTSSMMLVMLPVILVVLVVPELIDPLMAVHEVSAVHNAVAAYFSPVVLLVGIVLPEVAMTCVVAAVHRQPRFFAFGLFFLPLRTLDAAVALYALVAAWSSRSNGRWRSPRRRPNGTEHEFPDPESGTRRTEPVLEPPRTS